MPNKNNNRMGRIDEEYRKELSQIIGFELKNSRCNFKKERNK